MGGDSGRETIFGVIRRCAAEVLAALGDRVELFSIELQEEKEQIVRSFFWMALLFFFAVNACIFLSLALVFFVGVEHRLEAFGGLGLFYTCAAVGVFLVVRRRRKGLKRPFVYTLDELRRDGDVINN